MSTPTFPMIQRDIGEASGYVFRSRNWFGKLAVGALDTMFFWVLISLFILRRARPQPWLSDTFGAVSAGRAYFPRPTRLPPVPVRGRKSDHEPATC